MPNIDDLNDASETLRARLRDRKWYRGSGIGVRPDGDLALRVNVDSDDAAQKVPRTWRSIPVDVVVMPEYPKVRAANRKTQGRTTMLVARTKEDQNKAAIDPWTAVHVGFGLGAGLMDIPFWWAMGGAVAYEIFEQWLERTEFGQNAFKTSGPETPMNAVVDVIVFAGGWWLGQKWNATGDAVHT